MKYTPRLIIALSAGLVIAGTAARADLVGYYPLDGDFQDASGNGNHGTLVGAGTAYSGSVPTTVGGGQSVSFPEAAGHYGNIQNAAQSGGLALTTLPSFSVSMWVNGVGTANRDDRIFSEGMTTNNNPLFNIGTHSSGANGTVDVFIRNGGAFGHAYSPGTAFDGTWHHVMFTGGEDGLLDLYIDGVFDAQFNYSGIAVFTPDTTTIGGILRGSDCCNFNGNIDDVSFWDEELTADDAAATLNVGDSAAIEGLDPLAIQLVTFQEKGSLLGQRQFESGQVHLLAIRLDGRKVRVHRRVNGDRRVG